MAKKFRLDVVLVEQGLFGSREQAQRAVMAGEVKLGDRVLTKSSILVAPDDPLSVAAPPKYVGRGGFKLEGALDHFQVEPAGATALDIGASTGGFTDCLLQRGATKVYAIDVGHGQLAWKIRNDPRVTTREHLNARHLTRADIPEPIDICVIDVSFISLTLILPSAFALLTPTGMLVALIKPQFELEPQDVGRGGIVRDPALHAKAQQKIEAFVAENGHEVVGVVPSPITGTEGNHEFFVCARKRSVRSPTRGSRARRS
jgi:23S rRNA (cytidine1920-2'-O)/16S rRNA (cytidine1409-2'-O)-methyltransferase